jgi:hypothetical protein
MACLLEPAGQAGGDAPRWSLGSVPRVARARSRTKASRYRIEAHARARPIPRQLAQSRVAMTPGTASRLLVVVQRSSARHC